MASLGGVAWESIMRSAASWHLRGMQAVVTAAVLELGGAFLVGSHVSHTMQSGIVNAAVFAGRPGILFTGMLASLAASGTWLQVRAPRWGKTD